MFDDEMRVDVADVEAQPKQGVLREMLVEIRDNVRELQSLVRAAIENDRS